MYSVSVNENYFRDLYQTIQHDIYCNAPSAVLRSSDFIWTPDARNSLNAEIVQLLNKRGFVLISMVSPSNINEIIQWQNEFLGPSMKDRRDNSGYSAVRAEKNAKFFINSNLTQPIHTDEGYTSNFPRYISLYCETPSAFGGITTLVHSDSLLKNLKINFADHINLLFNHNAIHIKNVDGYLSKNILIQLKDGRIGVSYSPMLRGLTCDKRIFDMFSTITLFVHNPENQIRFKLAKNQLLIIDNCIVLHGRTKFLASEDRLLYRMWFSECSLTSNR